MDCQPCTIQGHGLLFDGRIMATPKKEHPYQEPPKVARVRDTLLGFGFKKLEARYIAREIVQNLDNYLAVQDAMLAHKRREQELLKSIPKQYQPLRG